MKKVSTENLVQLIANLGIIAGLIFLGFELYQNNALLASQAYEHRATYVQEIHMLLATDEELASLVLKARGDEELSELEAYQFDNFWLSIFYNLQWAQREMSREELESTIKRFRGYFLTVSGVQATWTNESHRFSSEFVDWVDENIIVD